MNDGRDDRLAPVIPLFGGRVARASELSADGASSRSEDRRPTVSAHPVTEPAPSVRTASAPLRGPSRMQDEPQRAESAEPDDAEVVERAEEALLRKLRARSLSVSEARQVLRAHDLDAVSTDDMIDRFCHLGYLDDAVLAEQIVISGVERKGQGRVALSRALAQRGIARDTIDAALGDLPDDDAERALEYARSKARSLSRLDFDTAIRRLMGQLARRGYGGSVAMTAARTALNEESFGGPTTGVRFVDSE